MKKTVSLLLAFLMLSGAALFALPAAADDGGELLNISHPAATLENPLAILREAAGPDSYKEILSAHSAPSQILVDGDDVSDFGDLFDACRASTTIPVIKVTETAQIEALYADSEENSFYDITVISADPSLLALARAKSAYIRTGLEVTLPNGEMTSKEADAIRSAVRRAPATFCVTGPEFANVRNVRALQSLAIAVWVDVGDGGTADILRTLASGCNGIIGSDDGAIADAINTYCDPGTVSRTPLFIGHRGYETRAPENSLDSFREALENGGEIFEIDVDITKDGHIVVMHDGSINRTTNYDGPLSIGEMTLEEIREYNIVSDVYCPGKYRLGEVTDLKVPTLEEVLELLALYPGHRVFIELKGSNLASVDGVARIVKEYGMEDQVDVISFNASMLSRTYGEGNLPGMSTGYLGGVSTGVAETDAALACFFSNLKTASSINSSINFSGSATRAYATVSNDRGMTTWPWTFNYYSNDRAFFSGASGITTSDVGWAADMFTSVSARDIEVGTGKKTDPGITALTYSGETVTVAPKNVTPKIIEGDCVSVSNGRIVGEKAGTATVVFSVLTETAANTAYSLISVPVTVTVTEGGPGVDRDSPDDDGPEPPPEREGKDILISHLNEYNWYSNDGMIIVEMGRTQTVRDLSGVGSAFPSKYVMYSVEKRDGKYIATGFVSGSAVNDVPVPDPVDGFLLLFAPSNRSFADAKGGRLLGWELEPKGFEITHYYAGDTIEDPSDVLTLKAYRPDPAFSDVKRGEYYEDPVTWAVNMDITTGTGDGKFSPADPCTRAQVVTLLWRAAGSPEPTGATNPFRDVKSDVYYCKAVLWAVEKGITLGTDRNSFSPGEPCTRGQIVTFLWRANGEPKPKSESSSFTDVKKSDYFSAAVLWAVGKGVTNGTTDKTFSPASTCTRAQIVTFLYRDKTN
ncbi:MAG: S-layer homology domain-containing protein [Clostridia bacterium]|nr:S-layer homology domain-containing protein [Clostridia bacterium]